jgi:hypothetical protein
MIESSQNFPEVLLQLYEIVSQASLIEPRCFETSYYLEAVTVQPLTLTMIVREIVSSVKVIFYK